MKGRSTRRWMVSFAAGVMAAFMATTARAAVPSSANPSLTVMTQNMDEGTGFGLLLPVTTFAEFVAAATATYQEVQAGHIPDRAAAVAGQIAKVKPALVSLQEVALWRTGPLFSSGASIVAFDSLQSLLDALTQQGLHYAAIATIEEFDFESPTTLGFDVRLTDRDVILARTDLPLGQLSLGHVDTQHFSTLAMIPTVAGRVTFTRGWASVDATAGGRTFRFIATHLDAVSPLVQTAQAAELVSGPANTDLPVIMAGDFNSAAAGGPDVTLTYGNLLAAGFSDVWTATQGGSSGFTWPLHLEDPLTSTATPTERIDLVLTRGAVQAGDARLVGNTPAARTSSGLFPSDHAGVVATLKL